MSDTSPNSGIHSAPGRQKRLISIPLDPRVGPSRARAHRAAQNQARNVSRDLASQPQKSEGMSRALKWALGASLAFHAVILGIRFASPPEREEPAPNPMLMAVLVNASSTLAPTRATVIAQRQLDGGGELDAGWMPSSPLERGPTSVKLPAKASAGESAPDAPALERQVRELMTQSKSLWTAPNGKTDPSQKAADETERLAMEIAARIDKQASAYASRPKKAFVGLQAAQSELAPWVEAWQRKVESVGTQFYPEGARGRVRGALILTVGMRKDGSVESISIDKSSGEKVLDDAAKKILTLSAPFDAFGARLAKKVDIIYVTRQWTFGPAGLERIEGASGK